MTHSASAARRAIGGDARIPSLWRLPLLAGLAALYLSYAGWADDSPPTLLDLVVSLTADTLDPLDLRDLL